MADYTLKNNTTGHISSDVSLSVTHAPLATLPDSDADFAQAVHRPFPIVRAVKPGKRNAPVWRERSLSEFFC